MSEKLKELKEELDRKHTWNTMLAGQLDMKIERLKREIYSLEED